MRPAHLLFVLAFLWSADVSVCEFWAELNQQPVVTDVNSTTKPLQTLILSNPPIFLCVSIPLPSFSLLPSVILFNCILSLTPPLTLSIFVFDGLLTLSLRCSVFLSLTRSFTRFKYFYNRLSFLTLCCFQRTHTHGHTQTHTCRRSDKLSNSRQHSVKRATIADMVY